MIKSMTGFGRCEIQQDSKKFTVELKSVNHRYLDVNIRMPKKLNFFETSIRTLLKSYANRGKVDIFITYEDLSQAQSSVKYNPLIAAEYMKYFKQMEEEFGLENEDAHIINGHVPVKCKDGENPVKCGGKVLVIDGGFSKAYQKETGIAGYTLIYNSYGLILAAHKPFESTEAAIEKESDIHSDSTVVKRTLERKKVEDTDVGKELKEQISDLEVLLAAYRSGVIAERM